MTEASFQHKAGTSYPKSQPFYQRYRSILPTSLTHIILINQRLITLETWCGFRYGLGHNLGKFYLTGFSMIIIKKPHKAKLYLSNVNNFFSNQFISEVTSAYFTVNRNTRVIKERRNLLWAFINTSPVGSASQPRTSPLIWNLKFRNINLIPFRTFYGFLLVLRTD